MKFLVSILLGLVLASGQAYAFGGFQNECFNQTVYVSGTATGGSGASYGSPKPWVDGDLWAIPANTMVHKVYVLLDVAVTGTTAATVGDDDDADGFTTDFAAGFGTPGLYGFSAKSAGAYLRVQTAGATDAADIDVTDNAKYYSATGKEVKLDVTTANTAGKARVVIEGCRMKPTGL
jgi:hypothetical protein